MADTTSSSEDDPIASSAPAPLSILVVHSADRESVGKRIDLGRSAMVLVGRDVAHGLRINDARLSQLHLRIVFTNGQLGFADAGSRNGTFLNGERSSGGDLAADDVLRAGDTLLVIDEPARLDAVKARAYRSAGSQLPVLIHGETGTGKELLARSIHDLSQRAGAFVAVNCATLPRELAAGELFGHVRGAFSGAVGARSGLFRSADGGTLFLDEVGDLPLELQPTLLRVLEERRVRPVGSDQDVAVDARIVAATHVDLEAAVRAGSFRADLLARFAQIVLTLPPLRERRAEVVTLFGVFASELELTANAAEALLLHGWPRNVRELRAIAESSHLLLGERRQLRLSDIENRVPASAAIVRERARASEPPIAAATRGPGLERRKELLGLLEQYAGNVAEVARHLGKPRAQIYRWLRGLGINVDDFRDPAEKIDAKQPS